jgi:hypothetical protein
MHFLELFNRMFKEKLGSFIILCCISGEEVSISFTNIHPCFVKKCLKEIYRKAHTTLDYFNLKKSSLSLS